MMKTHSISTGQKKGHDRIANRFPICATLASAIFYIAIGLTVELIDEKLQISLILRHGAKRLFGFFVIESLIYEGLHKTIENSGWVLRLVSKYLEYWPVGTTVWLNNEGTVDLEENDSHANTCHGDPLQIFECCNKL